MAYSTLARALSRRSGLDISTTVVVMREFVGFIKHELRQGNTIRVPGLGLFRNVYQKPKRIVCNIPGPHKGEIYHAPLRVRPFLVPSRALVREERGMLPRELNPPAVEAPRNKWFRSIMEACEKAR